MKKILFLLSLLYTPFCFSQYTEESIYEYIDRYKELAILKMYEYKIPASITLAQGIFESACGTSRLAKYGNNHFGIKCHKEWSGDTLLVDDDALGECFRKYEKAEESYNDHSQFLTSRPRYSALFTLDIMDYKAWAHGLKAAGYATNPKYADRLISLIERFNIAKQDTIYKDRLASGYFQLNREEMERLAAENRQQEMEKEKEELEPTLASDRKAGLFAVNEKEYKRVNFPFSTRPVYENNKTCFVIAGKDDTYKDIARDVQLSERNLRKFNDEGKNTRPEEYEVIYIEQKRKNHPGKTHKVQKGETLRYISQKYAIQLEYIYKYNGMSDQSIIYPGNQIKLK